MQRFASLGLTLVAAVALSVSCDDGDGEPKIVDGACEQVIEACHPKDDGSDETINGCHSRAHELDDAVCSMDLEECLATCEAAEPVGDDGHDDHGEDDHGHDDHGGETGSVDSDGGDTGGHDTDGHDTHDHDTGEHDSGEHDTGGTDEGSDSTGASTLPGCAEIAMRCHDVGSEVGQMCHDVGHDNDEEACAAIAQQCVDECF